MSNNFVIHLAVPHPTRHTSQKHLLFGIVVAGGDVFISALSAGAIESRNNDPFICVCAIYVRDYRLYTHTMHTHLHIANIVNMNYGRSIIQRNWHIYHFQQDKWFWSLRVCVFVRLK